jgi:hypothetical protein
MSRRGRTLEWTLGLLALTMAAIFPASAAGPDPAPSSHLQGTWRLNEDLTARIAQNHPEKPPLQVGGMEGMGGLGGRPDEGGFPVGQPGGPRGGLGGPPQGSPNLPPRDLPKDGSGKDPEAQGTVPTALNTLTIAQGNGEVTITDQQGHARVLRTDGSKVRDDKAPGGPAEIQAKWDKDGSLVVRVKPARGRRRTESYIVSNDGKHLYVVLTMEWDGRQPETTIRRAYDPVPAK